MPDGKLPNSKRRRQVRAPPATHPELRSTVSFVECAEDEDVDWEWSDSLKGRFVSGYRIVPRRRKTDL